MEPKEPKLVYDPISNETHCSKCGMIIMVGSPEDQSDKDQEKWEKHYEFHTGRRIVR